jgi:hypothetical protein
VVALLRARSLIALYFTIDRNGNLGVDYLYYLGLIPLDDYCFYTIRDFETPSPEDFGRFRH